MNYVLLKRKYYFYPFFKQYRILSSQYYGLGLLISADKSVIFLLYHNLSFTHMTLSIVIHLSVPQDNILGSQSNINPLSFKYASHAHGSFYSILHLVIKIILQSLHRTPARNCHRLKNIQLFRGTKEDSCLENYL